jgi:hypothetical protein
METVPNCALLGHQTAPDSTPVNDIELVTPDVKREPNPTKAKHKAMCPIADTPQHRRLTIV